MRCTALGEVVDDSQILSVDIVEIGLIFFFGEGYCFHDPAAQSVGGIEILPASDAAAENIGFNGTSGSADVIRKSVSVIGLFLKHFPFFPIIPGLSDGHDKIQHPHPAA